MKKPKRRPGSKSARRHRHPECSTQSTAPHHEANSLGPVDHTPSSRTSRHRSESQVPSLTSAILQYMPSIDADDHTDVLASRYYANMAALPSDADRLPRPMNSTLPMFSRSVISGRTRLPSRASDGSLQGQRQTSVGARVEDVPRIGRSMSAVTHEVDRVRRTSCPREDVESGGEVCGDKAQHEVVLESEEPCADTELAQSDNHEELSAAEPAQSETHEELPTTELAHPDHEEPLDRRASTGSCIDIVDEKNGLGLNVASRPSSHMARRTHPIAPTQYKPAAKKTAIARAAPGLSYMFSPTIGSSASSRPSSIVGTSTPTAQHVQSRVQSVLPPRMVQAEHVQLLHGTGEPGQSPDEAEQGTGEDATHRTERKLYGSINVGALEQFLEEGRVPDTSSDEFSEESEWDGDYYSGSEASSAPLMVSPPSQQSQQQLSRYTSIDESDILGNSPHMRAQALAGSQASPRIRSSMGPEPDEHAPLLGQTKQTYGSEFIVPADLPQANEMSSVPELNETNTTPFAKTSSPALRTAGSSVRPSPELYSGRKSHYHKRRRRQRNHEELFLDKDGFIDESYRFTFFNPAVGTVRAQEIADLRTPTMDLASLLQVGGCFWIDVLRPSFQEMHLLSKVFGIHALTVEDIMTQDAREKCEIHANYYFVCFRSFDNDTNGESYLEPKCVYNVVLREGIITFHMEPSVHQYHVLRRIRRQIDHIVVTPDWLNYAIIDDITDLLAPILHRVEFDVDAIDELVLVISSSEQSDMLLRISTVRKRIMMAMRLLQGKADVVRALIKRFESATAFSTTQINALPVLFERAAGGPATVWSESPRRHGSSADRNGLPDVVLDQRKGHETILYLGDVLDHIVTMMQNATHYDNMLGRAQTNYLAQISIELTESSNYTNDVVAKLSALAAIVVPLNFITGMWGANVKVPGQDIDNLHYFFYILGMCLLYVVVAVCFARRYQIF
ncbi:CorA metal ion transporter [Coemansia sp. RSA 1822]|nr:CorA metal ion transporter [Coemansia sp. RSA 638]KAJ2540697.1 CorA metal ion transporter [Coemansia sp. RSA 1853]KAJ2560841.1 CorA metal ion transporter [Coemansia sp. RSA 1822]